MAPRRTAVVFTLVLGTLMAFLPADAQPPAKVPRIGWLALGPPPAAPSSDLDAFRQGLRELGYVEGRNLVIEYRWASGMQDRLRALAVELAHLKVDVIVVGAGGEILAAKHATKEIPIVMVLAGDAVGSGLVTSLARPGGNLTGLSVMIPELSVKLLELLKEAVPRVSRVAVLYNPTYPALAPALKEMHLAAKGLGWSVYPFEVRASNEFDGAFAAITRARAHAVIAIDPFVRSLHGRRVLEFVARERLPAVAPARDFAEAGGLLAYGPYRPEFYRRAATYVDKILKGVKPADLPVEQPTRFEMVVNLKTARALGLTLPAPVLLRADQVIQ